MKENKKIEQLLLNDSSYEEMVNAKIEKNFIELLGSAKSKQKDVVTDFKLAPKEKLFSKDAVYVVINKNNKTKSYINGIQAEGFLGAQNTLREKFLSAKTDFFISGDNYVKFFKIKV